MITFQQLVKQVSEKLEKLDDGTAGQMLSLELIVAAAVGELGFHVNERTGEIVDPRPKPVNVFTPPRQQNVRWRGGRRPR
jgi:hypothetical protein